MQEQRVAGPEFEGPYRVRFLNGNGGTRDPLPGEWEAQRKLIEEALSEGDLGEQFDKGGA